MTNLPNKFNEILDNFVMKGRTKPLIVYCALFSRTWLDDCSFLFLNTYFNNDSL